MQKSQKFKRKSLIKTLFGSVLPTVAINRQIRDFLRAKKCKNRQFWPIGDFWPIYYHIKMQENRGSGDKSPFFAKKSPMSAILNKIKLATLVWF